MIDRDLFMAILSLDAYNRGYAPGLEMEGNQLGTATIIDWGDETAQIEEGWESHSFFASAYTWNGQDIISYRGTDAGLADMWNGWVVGSGDPGTGLLGRFGGGSQANYSIEFYNAVARRRDGNEEREVYDIGGSKPIVTGHSLGGGLAGFVGTLSGSTIVAFDHMPFLVAAFAAFTTEFHKRLTENLAELAPLGYTSDSVPSPELLELLNLEQPRYEQFVGYALEGEINAGLRNGSIALAVGGVLGGLGALIPGVGPILAALAGFAGGSIAGGPIAETEVLGDRLTTYETDGWSMLGDTPLTANRHSIAVLTMFRFAELKEAEDASFADWRVTGVVNDALWSLYDTDLALAAGSGAAHIKGKNASTYTAMQSALAYSAITEGERPFGDTGIFALFDDWGDLGGVVKNPGHSSFFDQNVDFSVGLSTLLGQPVIRDVKAYLARIATQYAGALALYDVEQSDALALPEAIDAREGVLALSEDDSILALDLSNVLWDKVIKTGRPGAPAIEPADKLKFEQAFFSQSDDYSDFSLWSVWRKLFGMSAQVLDEEALRKIALEVWESDTAAIIDRFHMAADENREVMRMEKRSYTVEEESGPETHVDVFIAPEATKIVYDTIYNDLIVLGGNDSKAYLSGGRDHVVGGKGNDEIIDYVGGGGSPPPAGRAAGPEEEEQDDVSSATRWTRGCSRASATSCSAWSASMRRIVFATR